MPVNTKVTHLLDSHHISYRLLPHSEPVFTVATAAAQRGVVLEEMVKSILLREKTGQRRYVMAGTQAVKPQGRTDTLGSGLATINFCFSGGDNGRYRLRPRCGQSPLLIVRFAYPF